MFFSKQIVNRFTDCFENYMVEIVNSSHFRELLQNSWPDCLVTWQGINNCATVVTAKIASDNETLLQNCPGACLSTNDPRGDIAE